MSEKTLNARIINKHDIEANWIKATGFVPKQGEIIIYDVDSTHTYERFKIGDGATVVSSLPFVNDSLKTILGTQIDKVDDKVDAVSALVGDTTVSEQINSAMVELNESSVIKPFPANQYGHINPFELEDDTFYYVKDGSCRLTLGTSSNTSYSLEKGEIYYNTFYSEDEYTKDCGNLRGKNVRYDYRTEFDGTQWLHCALNTEYLATEKDVSASGGHYTPQNDYSPATKKYVDDLIATIPEIKKGNWNQNDPNAADYIENRTHYVELGENLEEVLPSATLAYNEDMNAFIVQEAVEFIVGKQYVVKFADNSGKVYEYTTTCLEAPENEDGMKWILGDTGLLEGTPTTGEPFILAAIDPAIAPLVGVGMLVIPLLEATPQSISIYAPEEIVHKIDPKFISIGGYGYEKNEVIFDQTVVFEGEEEGGWQMGQALPISVGDNVKVTFDGTVYESEALKFDAGVPGAVFFGNTAPFGGEDNGAPFVAGTSADQGMTMFMGDPGTHSIKIEKTVVQKIDPKYIPDGIGGGTVIVQDSAMASGVMPAEQATPTATMNAAEIAEAVSTGKTVYFRVQHADSMLLPFVYGYRFEELTSGVMTLAALPDPYALFGAVDEYGSYNYVKVFIDGGYWYDSFSIKSASTDTTLTESGMPADAKITGDAIRKVSTLVGDKPVSEQINEALLSSQADWSQTDSTKPDYIKNKPDEDDAIALLMEMNLVEPVVADDGSIYTDENGVMYTII